MASDTNPHRPPRSLSPLSSPLSFLLLLLLSNFLTFLFSSSLYSHLPCPPPPSSSSSISSSSSSSSSCSPSSPSSSSPRKIEKNLPKELLSFTSPQKLPFGMNPNSQADLLHSPIGSPCLLFQEELSQYMTYKVNGPCPDDELLAQRLLLKGCEPLPRRRCRPAAPDSFPEPAPLPAALWTTPPDRSVLWTAYSCKNFSCLINRKNDNHFYDCKDCFDLAGVERTRWITKSDNPLDFTIDEVLSLKPAGSVRIGLDIGGGSGSFAVRMKEKGVTIVATSMNLDGPFNGFMASRGIVPLYVSVSQRLPFFDNTLDIVHSMHVLSNWIPDRVLEFIVFDVYRVLRPGGVFWLDHFFFVEEQFDKYVGIVGNVGFVRRRWVVGRKLDRGPELKEMYISAVLEKPLENSW